jgi:hypothetical protein
MRLRICITLRIPTIIRVVQNTMTDTMIVDIQVRVLLHGGGIGLMILVLPHLLQSILTILTIVRCILIQNTPILLHVVREDVHHPIHRLRDTGVNTQEHLPENDITPPAFARMIETEFRIHTEMMIIHTHTGIRHIHILITKIGQENDLRMILSPNALQITKYKLRAMDNKNRELILAPRDTYLHMQQLLRNNLRTDRIDTLSITLTILRLNTPYKAVVSPVRMAIVWPMNMGALRRVLLFMLVDRLSSPLVESLLHDRFRYFHRLLWVVIWHRAS